jgi:hypothetical protein
VAELFTAEVVAPHELVQRGERISAAEMTAQIERGAQRSRHPYAADGHDVALRQVACASVDPATITGGAEACHTRLDRRQEIVFGVGEHVDPVHPGRRTVTEHGARGDHQGGTGDARLDGVRLVGPEVHAMEDPPDQPVAEGGDEPLPADAEPTGRRCGERLDGEVFDVHARTTSSSSRRDKHSPQGCGRSCHVSLLGTATVAPWS